MTNQTFLDWVVDTCDRLLASHAIIGTSEIQEACIPGVGNGVPESTAESNSELMVTPQQSQS